MSVAKKVVKQRPISLCPLSIKDGDWNKAAPCSPKCEWYISTSQFSSDGYCVVRSLCDIASTQS